jgi:hypothetical protein
VVDGRSIVVDLEDMEEHPNTSTFVLKVPIAALRSQVKSPMIAFDHQPRSLGMVLIYPTNCPKAILFHVKESSHNTCQAAAVNSKERPEISFHT